MVTDEIRERRPNDRSPNDRLDRGQIILIGAVALAFIILGVVVIFNGVLYTETLSSADTGQSASSAETTELEVRQGVSCLVAEYDSADEDDELETEIGTYAGVYRNARAHSQPAAVDLDVDESNPGDNVTIVITYNSTDLEYEREVTIDAEECES